MTQWLGCVAFYTANEDYVQGHRDQSLVFGLNLDTTQCVSIPIINDEVLEETEYFTVILSSDQDCVLFENNTARITVVDNDCESSSLKVYDYNVFWWFS